MTTAYYQENKSSGQGVKHTHYLQPASHIGVTDLVSDEEDNYLLKTKINNSSKEIHKDNRSSRQDVFQQKTHLQKNDAQLKNKSWSTPARAVEMEHIIENRPEPQDSYRNSLENLNIREPSLLPSKSAQAVGVLVSTRSPFGWVDHSPNTINNTSRQASISILPSIETTSPPPSRGRKRLRYTTTTQSSPSLSSETDSPTLHTSKFSNLKKHATTRSVVNSPSEQSVLGSYYNSSNSNKSKPEKSTSKLRNFNNTPGRNVSLSRSLYPSNSNNSSGPNISKFGQIIHKPRALLTSDSSSNVAPRQLSQNRKELKNVRLTADSSTSSDSLTPLGSDIDAILMQEAYFTPGGKGLRPRLFKETDNQKRNREWKLEYESHPFMIHISSLKNSIDIVNEVDQGPPPNNFKFITKNIFVGQVIEPDPAATYGCSCEPVCNPKSCSCVDERNVEDDPDSKRWGLPYNTNKRLTQAYLSSPLAIHECNAACSCSLSCRNRNVTLPHNLNLEIFKTDDRGWGLRSRDPIFKGQFVDTYRGEVLTDEEAIARSERSMNKNVYLFDLDKFNSDLPLGERGYVIDAEFMGSTARFINHSCDPNLRVFCVSLLRGNPRVYEVAFFAVRDIFPGEELSFDYQNAEGDDDRWINTLEPGNRRVDCLCGAPQCRRHFW